MEKNRNSSFEILRLICMLSIVLYHMLIFGLNDISENYWFYKALTILLHFGVPVFILISGWFGIKLSVKRIITILLPLYTYTLAVYFVCINIIGIKTDISGGVISSILLCKDSSPLWFIQPYLLLCLISPILNSFFENSSLGNKIMIYILLAFVVFGLGFIGNYAIAQEGYTLFCFSYLYLIGRGLRKYSGCINRIHNLKQYLFVFLFLIVIAILAFKYSGIKLLSMIAGGFFAYNSPLMYLYSIIIFYLFSFYTIESKVINHISKGAFTIYLLASNPLIMAWTTNKALAWYCPDSPYLSILWCCLFSLAICVISLLLDLIIRPVLIQPILILINRIKVNKLIAI